MALKPPPVADCGRVAAGRSGVARGGGSSAFGTESVMASVTDDTSGGGFTVTSIATYHVEEVDPGELPPHHHGPPPTVLVTDAHVDGPGPLMVSAESPLISVDVAFTAPATPSSDVYTATVVLTGSHGHQQTVPARAEVPVSLLSYRVGTVSGDTISWGDSHRYGAALIASVALYGNVAVEVHVVDWSGALWHRMGIVSPDSKTIDWGDSHHYDNSSGIPRVALYGNIAVETHEVSGGGRFPRLACRVGTVHPDSKIIDWADGQEYTNGEGPCLAVDSNFAVAVYQDNLSGDSSPDDILYRIGILDSGTILWREAHHYDNGFPTGIAMYADTVTPNTVVAVHNSDPPEGRGQQLCWYRVGSLLPDLDVVAWGDSHHYDNGYFPVVALYRNTVVEVHHGDVSYPNGDPVAALWYRVGVVSPTSNTITWGNSRQYDSGVWPTVAIYGNTVVEVHSSAQVARDAGATPNHSRGMLDVLNRSRTEEVFG